MPPLPPSPQDAIGRLNRVKSFVERLPQWKERVLVRQRASNRWQLSTSRVRGAVGHPRSLAPEPSKWRAVPGGCRGVGQPRARASSGASA